MTPWYGHTIDVKIDNTLKFPKYGGKLSFLDTIISTETDRLNKKLKFLGQNIVYELALRSQFHQRRAITELDAVDTGRLRDSVRISGRGLSANIGTDLYYAETVHDIGYKNQTIFNINGITIRGHSDIGPRPWTEYAADDVARDVEEIVSTSLNQLF